jgi:Rps23 Pro-64 3,4-dihydroxylase Tpa1-like proline 4-hydroxylase
MTVLKLHDIGGYLAFDEGECRAAGRDLAGSYASASPFPHVVLEDFLDPGMLRAIAQSYPASDGKAYFDRDQERLKYQYQPQESSSPLVRNLLAELNGQAFLGFLQEMTGIEGLISDPYYAGGGLHETKRGGHLGVHADFNIHAGMRVQRRLNLLVYLNEDWPDEFGGKLELWDREMKGCEVAVAPLLGRAVVFSTDLDSYHGHPDPLECPPDRSRRSIATYYYTAPEEGLRALPARTTNFRYRPGSGDRTDWRVRIDHLINDWVPHRLQGYARRLL